jgi:hypothetical protein
MTKWRYQVVLEPGVSIAPRRFVRVVEVDGPDPWEAVKTAMADMDPKETHLWQSDDATIRVERVA